MSQIASAICELFNKAEHPEVARDGRKGVLESFLSAARHIYASRGFVLESSEPFSGFGRNDVVSETWRLKL